MGSSRAPQSAGSTHSETTKTLPVPTMEKQLVYSLSSKLNIKAPNVIRQAQELLRLSEIKSQSLSFLNLPPSCVVVMCLELSCVSQECPMDKAAAIRYSGVKKKSYSSSYKVLEQMLDLRPRSNVREIAIQFGCNEAVELAQKVFLQYQESYKGLDMDFSTSLFHSAALVVASRNLKLKIDKTKLVALSGSKKTVFDKLIKDMDKCLEKLKEKTSKVVTSNPKKRRRTFLEELKDTDSLVPNAKSTKCEEDEKTLVSDYEEWKKKILAKASAS